MYNLFVHNDAKEDLEQLWKSEPRAAARISAILEELDGNQDLLDRLTQHGFGTQRSNIFHVSRWLEHWNKGINLWRFKVWDLENIGLRYRIIYCFVPTKSHYYILAIAPRDFDYERTHPITQRVLRFIENL